MDATAETLLIRPNQPAPDLRPDASCFCGSGKRFQACCGSFELQRPPPAGLFMFENYMDRATVSELLHFVMHQPGEPLAVLDSSSTPDNIVKVKDQRRVAERVNLGDRRQQVNQLVRDVFVELAWTCLGARLDWFEAPDVMRYRSGGYYKGHADSENFDRETGQWKKIIDRDLSLLIYLNDDFEGGELSFYKLRYQVWPRPGAAVMFPSDHRFVHQAEQVKSGERYALVSWGSVKGIPKIASKPPESAIMIE